jgi:hypothetical protein
VRLRKLQDDLPRQGLDQFTVFNTAYYIVTKNIQEAAADNYFEHPEFIQTLTTHFAEYYFRAIRQTKNNSSKLPAAWARLNAHGSDPAFMALLLGANAHINHDLPNALLDVMPQNQEFLYMADVKKVSKLLMKSGKQIITSFDEPNRFHDALKRHCQFLYYRPIMYTILYWRIRAWRAYGRLKTATT